MPLGFDRDHLGQPSVPQQGGRRRGLPRPDDGNVAKKPGRFEGSSLSTSPWFSGAMGVSTALPSVEYMAL
ncbi:hypothetical protein H7H51_07360, partial [Mycolicibacterium farcinogenes]|nr:hypothetical protein [Mycolicibacterium farcinogenes]